MGECQVWGIIGRGEVFGFNGIEPRPLPPHQTGGLGAAGEEVGTCLRCFWNVKSGTHIK